MFFTVNKKVLLVGGTGYLGRHLRDKLLRDGIHVTVTGFNKSNEPNHYRIDFEDPETFSSIGAEQFDTIFILVSKLQSLGTCQLDHPDLETNVLGLGRFLEYLKRNSISDRLVYISSMTVYSPNNESPVEENTKLAPSSTYGLSKTLAEGIFEFYCQNEVAKGVVMRFPGIYGGDRRSGFIYNTIQKVSAGQEVILNTKGLGYWETIHISDLVEMIAIFLARDEWDETINTFNFSYGEETDFRTTASHIAKKMNRSDLITIDGERGYVKLYISNTKVRRYTKPSMDYWTRLNEYIDSLI